MLELPTFQHEESQILGSVLIKIALRSFFMEINAGDIL
jgi:hypothetical protein